MTHGYIPPEPRPPLVTVWPGPTLMVWLEGVEVARVSMTPSAALVLASQLLVAASTRIPAQTTTPTENLPFAAQQDDRRAAGVRIHADGETFHPQFDGDHP